MESDILTHTVVPEEAHDLKDRARSFAREEMQPVAAEYFGSGEYPDEVVEAAHDAGLVAQEIDAEYGGPGRSLDEIVATVEEFFRADAGLGLGVVSQSFGTEILQKFGSEEQKGRTSPPSPAARSGPEWPSPNPTRGATSRGWRRRRRSRPASGS